MKKAISFVMIALIAQPAPPRLRQPLLQPLKAEKSMTESN